MRFEVEHVTPEVAAQWLAKPWGRQRTISDSVVLRYARAMQEGRWVEPSTESIGFTAEGELGNGQHRLLAVIRSGWEGDMLVAYDVPIENFLVMDTGRKRQATQFVRLANASVVTAAARIVLWYDLAHPKPLGGGSATGFDNDEVLEYIDAHAEALCEAARLGRSVYVHTDISASIHSGVLFIAARDGVEIEDWVTGLETGAGLRPGDPRLALREWALKHKNASRGEQWQAIVHAFNAYLHGRTLTRIQRSVEGTPLPVIQTVGPYQRKATNGRVRQASQVRRGAPLSGAAARHDALIYEPPRAKGA